MRRATVLRLTAPHHDCHHRAMAWVHGTYRVELCPVCQMTHITGFPPGAAVFNW